MTPEFLEAALDGRLDEAARLIGVDLPEDFLRERGRRFFAMRLKQMRKDLRFLQWCPHVVVSEGRMIGHAGYHGPPGVNANRDETAVEIGYAIERPFRGQGHATAAALELIRVAEERGVRHYIASVSPSNDPSLAIVRKLGFVQTGERMDDEDGLELVFELERPLENGLDQEVQGQAERHDHRDEHGEQERHPRDENERRCLVLPAFSLAGESAWGLSRIGHRLRPSHFSLV